MTTASIKVTRINRGIYDAVTPAGHFEIEQYPDGNWLVFKRRNDTRDFCNDYATKRAAVASLRSY